MRDLSPKASYEFALRLAPLHYELIEELISLKANVILAEAIICPTMFRGMWVAHCPMNEGDTVCARDAVPMVQESRPAPSPRQAAPGAAPERAYGSLWRPSRARKPR